MKKKNESSKEMKAVVNKEKLSTKFLNVIKKRWLISGTNTILLIAILVAVVIIINKAMSAIDLTPIDCTSNKEYTLTDESKERVSKISDKINVYLVGYTDSDSTTTLVKQYNKANENINVETIDITERTDIADKYSISSGSTEIIVEDGEKSKTLSSSDLYTYDSSYNTIDVTEEKVTSAILTVSKDEIPNVYILTGYSSYDFTQDGGMYYLANYYLANEVLNYNELNILVSGAVPENCNTLIIPTPSKDFDELTTNAIIDYINEGGNILWLNSSYSQSIELTNVNKILALYGIDPFSAGYVYETDDERTILGYNGIMAEDLGNSEIDSNLTNVILAYPTKINVNSEAIESQNVEETDVITTGDTTYFKTDISNTGDTTGTDEQGGFTIGGIFTKTFGEESTDDSDSDGEESESEDDENTLKSTLVIFGDNDFISDAQISSQISPMVALGDNKDVVLNSIAYLTEQDEDITIRKDYTSSSSFTATDAQKKHIIQIIFEVPLIIMLIGIVVWIKRIRKR